MFTPETWWTVFCLALAAVSTVNCNNSKKVLTWQWRFVGRHHDDWSWWLIRSDSADELTSWLHLPPLFQAAMLFPDAIRADDCGNSHLCVPAAGSRSVLNDVQLCLTLCFPRDENKNRLLKSVRKRFALDCVHAMSPFEAKESDFVWKANKYGSELNISNIVNVVNYPPPINKCRLLDFDTLLPSSSSSCSCVFLSSVEENKKCRSNWRGFVMWSGWQWINEDCHIHINTHYNYWCMSWEWRMEGQRLDRPHFICFFLCWLPELDI